MNNFLISFLLVLKSSIPFLLRKNNGTAAPCFIAAPSNHSCYCKQSDKVLNSQRGWVFTGSTFNKILLISFGVKTTVGDASDSFNLTFFPMTFMVLSCQLQGLVDHLLTYSQLFSEHIATVMYKQRLSGYAGSLSDAVI